MQSNLPDTKILVYISVLFFLISSCKKEIDFENQITIKINSIDSKTKQRRVNFFDNVEVRKEGFGFIKKTFPVEKIYTMDSMGSVKIKIDTTKIYDISVLGLKVLGGDMYYPGHLKDGQEVNIEVKSYEN
jgi:preprotein translocase subunit SecF